jgi:hypothetical protein
MAEKRTIELEVKESGFKSLKAQIKEANIELIKAQENFGDYSQEAIKAAKNVAALKDKIAEASETAALFDPGKKFQVATGAITAAAGAMSAYEGAMGLVGVESEQLEKTMLKVQSAMALSQGLSAVADARKDFARLGAVVGDVFGKMTAASKAFMVGGIGLLIAGVSLLVANWDNLTASSNKAVEEQKKLAEETKKFNEESKETTKKVAEESSAFVSLVYQLKATNANSKERSTLMKEINSKYGTTLKNLSDENLFQAQLNKSVEEYIELQYNKLKIEKNQESFDRKLAERLGLEEKRNKLLKEYREESFKAGEAVTKHGETITRYNSELQRQENVTWDVNESIEAFGARMQDFGKAYTDVEAALQKNADATEKVVGRREKLIETDSRLTQGGKVYVEQVEKQTKVVTDATEKINKNAIEGSLELRKIKEFDNEISLDMLKKQVDAEALITKEARDKERDAVAAALKEREKQRNEAFTLDAAKEMLDIIGDLAQQSENKFKALNAAVLSNQETTDAQKQKLLDENNKRAKKAFEIQKAASIASTLINTYMSARSAYFSQFLPIPDPSSPIRGGIAAGLSVAGGLVAVKNIASQKFEGASMSGGGGGGGGSMGGGGAPTAPNFNIVGNSGINQLAELGGQPIQAYVVSGEVTSAQALDRNRIQNASF